MNMKAILRDLFSQIYAAAQNHLEEDDESEEYRQDQRTHRAWLEEHLTPEGLEHLNGYITSRAYADSLREDQLIAVALRAGLSLGCLAL
ncbi:hypothetical protein D1159_03395 [Pseudoflavonifractor sp. 524-17]|uniref:hypothetical protein n=1 Tax=Pseudoflavonifractor sp. 524-17 TaxID=2304577 RepID=UPI0013794354|nr:hypothetical protein [Pseudoflavonifractor sp. 524-17]NCE63647.1 hypothetical protein [Pseudoflavonifractor sp. 524-17]